MSENFPDMIKYGGRDYYLIRKDGPVIGGDGTMQFRVVYRERPRMPAGVKSASDFVK